MKIIDRSFNEILSTQIIAIIGGLIVGTTLAVFTDRILLLPGMLILVPGFLEMRGSISGSLAARITSGLFLGVVNPKHEKTKLIKGNIIAAITMALIISLVLGILAFSFNYLVMHEYTPRIIAIALIAGIIANAIEIPITVISTFYLFKKGHDPNNIMGPFVAGTGDITSVIALLIALVII